MLHIEFSLQFGCRLGSEHSSMSEQIQLFQSIGQNKEWSIGQMLVSLPTSRQFMDETSMESISSPGYTVTIFQKNTA